MIEIKANRENLTLSIVGHAGYAEVGKDIVCSAVSTLLYTLLTAVDGMLDFDDYDIEAGKAIVRLYPKEDSDRDVRVIFDAILSGLKMIAENYPQNVIAGW